MPIIAPVASLESDVAATFASLVAVAADADANAAVGSVVLVGTTVFILTEVWMLVFAAGIASGAAPDIDSTPDTLCTRRVSVRVPENRGRRRALRSSISFAAGGPGTGPTATLKLGLKALHVTSEAWGKLTFPQQKKRLSKSVGLGWVELKFTGNWYAPFDENVATPSSGSVGLHRRISQAGRGLHSPGKETLKATVRTIQVLSVDSSEASVAFDWHKIRSIAFVLSGGKTKGILFGSLLTRLGGIVKDASKTVVAGGMLDVVVEVVEGRIGVVVNEVVGGGGDGGGAGAGAGVGVGVAEAGRMKSTARSRGCDWGRASTSTSPAAWTATASTPTQTSSKTRSTAAARLRLDTIIVVTTA